MIHIGINEGINSSVIVADQGKIIFALQEERVNRVKNFMGFPHEALAFAKTYLGLSTRDIDYVCLSNNLSPNWDKEAFLTWYDQSAECSDQVMDEGDIEALASAVSQSGVVRKVYRSVVPESIRKLRYQSVNEKPNQLVSQYVSEHDLGHVPNIRSHHHANHAASAYYGLRKNPVDPHLVLTLDGSGDGVVSHVYIGENGRMKLIASTPMGHSLGNIYSRVTHLMGMTPHEHEYKLMGLAAYCPKKYSQPIADIFSQYLDLDPANPLRFKCKVPELTNSIEPRLARDLKRARFDNIAGGLQLFTEDLLSRWVQQAVKQTGIRNVVAAGGVFMNVKANKVISELPGIDYFDVFPSCGDESLPFGAVWKHYAESSATNGDDIVFDSYCLGPDAGYDLANARAKYGSRFLISSVEDPELETARLLAKGAIVARCSGPMEFGARALGNRSILADPERYEVIPVINKMIKQRDFWMPFAPALLYEDAEKYITLPASLPPARISPHMMHTFDTTERRNEFMAGVHNYDSTARAQVVTKNSNAPFHRLIREFSNLSNKSVVLNTSFNLHGYPIVMGACDAIDVMLNSTLEYLFINDTLVRKNGVSEALVHNQLSDSQSV